MKEVKSCVQDITVWSLKEWQYSDAVQKKPPKPSKTNLEVVTEIDPMPWITHPLWVDRLKAKWRKIEQDTRTRHERPTIPLSPEGKER
jgi:hypothetical protein